MRIEDTDLLRSKKEYEEEILRSLKWLGVEWDEGPYFQSQRQSFYAELAQKLLSSGNAYKCYLTPEELERMRAEATEKSGQPKIRSPWRDRKAGPSEEGKPFAIRFRYPDTGQTVVRDGILGDVTFENSEGDDLIILRSDGTPTYQLSVVGDDLDMKITHVIRGDDHLNNTPKQLLMIKALGAEPPQYAHAPMILGPDKTKLSKRHGAVSVFSYAEFGYLPEAFRNSLIRLGWSHGDQELFTHEELCQLFDLSGCGKSPAVFDIQKLDWINSEFIKRKSPEDFVKFVQDAVHYDLSDLLKSPGSRSLLEVVQKSIHKANEVPKLVAWYGAEFAIDPAHQPLLAQTKPEIIEKVIQEIEHREWQPEKTFDLFKEVAASLSVKVPEVAKPVRVLLTGTLQSPDMGIVSAALGKDRVLERLKKFGGR